MNGNKEKIIFQKPGCEILWNCSSPNCSLEISAM